MNPARPPKQKRISKKTTKRKVMRWIRFDLAADRSWIRIVIEFFVGGNCILFVVAGFMLQSKQTSNISYTCHMCPHEKEYRYLIKYSGHCFILFMSNFKPFLKIAVSRSRSRSHASCASKSPINFDDFSSNDPSMMEALQLLTS